MHPRCRSTISAVVSGGKRTAKVDGKNVKVPAEMKYPDYKAVYLDKTRTLNEWQASLKDNYYKVFANSAVAINYFKPMVESWQKDLTTKEKAAIEKYSGNYYRVMNGYLRGRYSDSDFDLNELKELQATIQNLDSAIDKFNLQDNITVYRQCDYRLLKLFKNAKDDFVEKGYFSTSVLEDAVTKRDITLEIKVPKGKGRGAFIETLSINKGENEFLIAHGSKFKVLSIEEQSDGRFLIKLEQEVDKYE